MATPTLVVRKPDGTEDEYEISGEMTVGRAEGNDLLLTAGGVSRRHARIWVQGGEVMVEDTGSANGTFIDDERIGEAAVLPPNSTLRIGDYELKLKAGPPGSRRPVRGGAAAGPPRVPSAGGEPPRASTRTIAKATRQKNPNAPPQRRPAGRPAGASSSPGGPGSAIERRPAARLPARAEPASAGPTLRGLTGPWANKRFPVGEGIVIGRSPGVQVLIDDDSVSRRHAELIATEEGVVLKDLDSANGTLLNGEPVKEELLVSPGDIIQVGVVELVLEDGEMANAAARRGGGRAARGGGEAASGGGRGRLLAVAVVMLLLFVGAAMAFKLTMQPRDTTLAGNPGGGGLDAQGQVQDFLNQCRSYASSDMQDPDWNKAEAACNKALDLDPINAEATTLIKRIKFEQENFDHFQKGEKAMTRLNEEEALDEFSRIKSGSEYYLKAKPKLKDAIAGLLRATQADCKRYINEGEWESAYPRCEKYMLFTCPNMAREDIVPPPGYRINLSGGRLKKNEWRPKDPMVRLFLQARMHKDPNLPVWECPRNEIVQGGPVQDLDREVAEALKKLYPEKAFADSVFLYWKGKPNDAVVILQKIRENISKAELHAPADALRKDMIQVASLFKAGETALQQGDALKAADPFSEALQIDERLMKAIAKDKPSFFRRSTQQEMAEAAYKNGKFWADREDVKRACKIWKTGFSFYKGNVDLLKATYFCTTKATDALKNAGSCDALAYAQDLAVEGDGLQQKIDARKSELKCP